MTKVQPCGSDAHERTPAQLGGIRLSSLDKPSAPPLLALFTIHAVAYIIIRLDGASRLIRLLIGDENLLVRSGLRALMTNAFAISEVGEAGSAAEVLANLRARTWNLVIGRDLSISPKSVSTYRSRILEKMRCRNNAEIARYAAHAGLI